MATRTLGTVATTSLIAIDWNPQTAQADLATIAANIKSQSNPARPIVPGGFSNGGRLFFPDRQGFLLLKPGDYVAYDSNYWPIVVSKESIAAGGTSWAHS